jgi:hypothetical protein
MPFFLIKNAILRKDLDSPELDTSEQRPYFLTLRDKGVIESSGPTQHPDNPLLQIRTIVTYVETYSDIPVYLGARRMDPTFYEVHIAMQEFCMTTGAKRLPMRVEIYDNDRNLVTDYDVGINDLF